MQTVEYNRKLNESYKICINELCNPPNWEDKVNCAKYTLDPILKKPKNFIIIELKYYDFIQTTFDKHTFKFKRSHFYKRFTNPQSRIKQDLIAHYSSKGYTIDLYQDNITNKWCLKIMWDKSPIRAP